MFLKQAPECTNVEAPPSCFPADGQKMTSNLTFEATRVKCNINKMAHMLGFVLAVCVYALNIARTCGTPMSPSLRALNSECLQFSR